MSQVRALPRGQLSVVRGQLSVVSLPPVPCPLHPDRQTGLWRASSRLVGLRRCLARILEGPESLQMSQVCARHKKFTLGGLRDCLGTLFRNSLTVGSLKKINNLFLGVGSRMIE
ncbi:MAG: hypothetical protein [Olavius algarvensis spirochete endosymbiont]|nr:MAG: hypothetical protein [Olavius algarvensis spirochete endosymbiont]